MNHSHQPSPRALVATPGLSLLRMSALSRVGIALLLAILLWAATLAVLG